MHIIFIHNQNSTNKQKKRLFKHTNEKFVTILYIHDSYQIDEWNIFKLSEIFWVCKYIGRCMKQNWGCWNMVQSLKHKHGFMSFLCISKPHVLLPSTVEKPWIMCQKSRQSLAWKMKIIYLTWHDRVMLHQCYCRHLLTRQLTRVQPLRLVRLLLPIHCSYIFLLSPMELRSS